MFGKTKRVEGDRLSGEVRQANADNGSAFTGLLEAIACSAVPVYAVKAPQGRRSTDAPGQGRQPVSPRPRTSRGTAH